MVGWSYGKIIWIRMESENHESFHLLASERGTLCQRTTGNMFLHITDSKAAPGHRSRVFTSDGVFAH